MKKNGFTMVEFLVLLSIIIIFVIALIPKMMGGGSLVAPFIDAGGFGPEKTLVLTVKEKHVDASEQSHYYLTSTEEEVFEIDNGYMLKVWNPDEIYGRMIVGETYKVTTKGVKTIWWLVQEYPYIVKAEPIQKEVK